jgi:serine phosphatase RsbU (regulator of sigma subunit)
LRFEELNRVITADRSKINEVLNNLGNYVNSYPVFDPSNPDLSITEYTFYSPAVYMDPDVFDNYFWGLVRIGVSTATIIQEIDDSRNRLILQTIIIAAISIAMGIIGALIMSSITIIPIRKLSRGVERIRDTVDKEKLKDHHIDIKTKDEIRTLADTVNQMTQGLVKAAMANKELIVGKEIQKMFIPLEKDKNGVQGTTGGMEDENIEIFGYYEGAKGVSGDYFDFKKLDATHYAIIKCDVAGKGVPAALIMVEVATIFLTYFRDWTLKNPGLKVNTLVYRINDMIEERGFKGRFAELTVAVLDTKTGNAYLCNAGDLLLSIYDSTQKKMIQKRLHDAPAAGVFPSMLLETKGGYQQVLHKLKKGDTLFLFTDGLHEAKRLFRDSNFKPIKCQEPDLKEGEMHGTTHLKSSGDEELGMERIDRIVSAVFNKDTYSLYKYHNAIVKEAFFTV